MIYIDPIEWRDIIIDGINTGHEVSSRGDVRKKSTQKIKKKYKLKKSKYNMVSFTYRNEQNESIKTGRLVSRLVAIAFIPIPEKYLQKGLTYKDLEADHIRDWDPNNHNDDSIYNLQWLTQQENIAKAQKYGLYEKVHLKGTKHPEWSRPGESNGSSIYKEKTIRKICKDLERNKLTIQEIAEKHNVKMSLVYDLKYKRAWPHVVKDYDFSHYNRIGGRRYQKDFTDKIDELLRKGHSNTEIYKILNIDKNDSIVKIRRKTLGLKTREKRTLTKEFCERLDNMILSGCTNKEIMDVLNLPHEQKSWVLICSHRRKLKTLAQKN